ncbi:hypothetical protein CAOG_05540 [Capsaspora owczarzaki ATCC 30864]|uniref:hypothetical protein n=1 Tax=Capsaspora owczarzaki (strain ATCC 30864) TaxID=595528 RepID=UPI000352344B|nr:hypothetical protein CAOG_05540 [Capsaspora owczarzaki ATCC 30864]|eukprot:XP_004346213.2 hypothetical protein CAOG_05540 [Capsaspora owczarzaki ATCC 30864]
MVLHLMLRGSFSIATRLRVLPIHHHHDHHSRRSSHGLAADTHPELPQPSPGRHPHLMKHGELTPGIPADEYAERRRALMRRLPLGSLVLVFGSTKHLMANDIPYPFHQNADMLYLTGLNEPDAVLMLQAPTSELKNNHPSTESSTQQQQAHLSSALKQAPSAASQMVASILGVSLVKQGDFPPLPQLPPPPSLPASTFRAAVANLRGEHTMTLFVNPTDRVSRLWDGPRAGLEWAKAHFRADRSFQNSEFAMHLRIALGQCTHVIAPSSDSASSPQPVASVFDSAIKSFPEHRQVPLQPFLHAQRAVKSPAELVLMRKAAEIAYHSFIAGMQATRPGVAEYQVFAAMQAATISRGAFHLSFPPVVAGGARATILHYVQKDQLLRANELVLVDFGSEYFGYCSDVSRTWPVSGKFNAIQRAVYEAVLSVNQKCIEVCDLGRNAGLRAADLSRHARNFTIQELEKLVPLIIQPQFRHLYSTREQLIPLASQLFPHSIGHFLGMDTHDTSEIRQFETFVDGMVFTIEPGLYIDEFGEHFVPEARGIGIRVEDNILFRSGLPAQVLTAMIPKLVDDIERVCAQ